MSNRRTFIKQTAKATAGVYAASLGLSAKSYANIIGANDRVRVGVVGFSDRFRQSHLPCFENHYKGLNFDMVAVSDLWKKRREEGMSLLKQRMGHDIVGCRNNEELYGMKNIDAVFISTPDFAHAKHAIEAVKAGCDAYVEKPFAETMEDNRAALKAVKESGRLYKSVRSAGAVRITRQRPTLSRPVSSVRLPW